MLYWYGVTDNLSWIARHCETSILVMETSTTYLKTVILTNMIQIMYILWTAYTICNTEVIKTKVYKNYKTDFHLKLYTNLVSPWYKVFLQHLIVIQLIKKFPVSVQSGRGTTSWDLPLVHLYSNQMYYKFSMFGTWVHGQSALDLTNVNDPSGDRGSAESNRLT
jgi:hypothetical protein